MRTISGIPRYKQKVHQELLCKGDFGNSYLASWIQRKLEDVRDVRKDE